MTLVREDLHVVADQRGNGAAHGKQDEKPCEPVVPNSRGKNHAATLPLLPRTPASGRSSGVQAIFLPRVRGTTMGSWEEQYFPLL